VEPRAFTPAPVGTNIAGLSVAHSWGAVLLDKTLPVEDLDGSTYSFVASYSRFIDLFGLTSRVSAAVPFATGDWIALIGEDLVSTEVGSTGFGDALAGITVFLVGAPAMTPTEFRDYDRKTIVGFDLRVAMPIGQYDPEKLINLGSNRWRVTPSVGVSHQMGKFSADAYAGAWFFTDNTSLLGDNVLSQVPLFAVQVNFAYSFRPRLWLAAGVRQTGGGRTILNGVARDDPTQNTRVGLVLGLPVARRHTVRLIGSTGLRSTLGNEYHTVALQWFVAW